MHRKNEMQSAVQIAIAVALLHTAAFFAHAWAHRIVPVEPTPFQLYFATAVAGLAPVIAAIMLAKRRVRLGGAMLLVAGIAAVWFGVANHYVIPSADNIASVPATPAGALFRSSAHALTATEIAAIALGAFLLGGAKPH